MKYGSRMPMILMKFHAEAEGHLGDEEETVLYVGHSMHMQTRLREHKSGKLAINKFLKQQFATANGGRNLGIKWVEDHNHKCVEGEYLDCIEQKLGYRPPFNMKDGNRCPPKTVNT